MYRGDGWKRYELGQIGGYMKRLLLFILTLCSTPIMAMQQPQTNYDGFIDRLQAGNKTVRDFIKEHHKQKHDDSIKNLQKEWKLTDKQINDVGEFVKLTKKIAQLRNNSTVSYDKTNDKSINQVYTTTEELYKKFNIKPPLIIKNDKFAGTGANQGFRPGEGAINFLNIGPDIEDCKGCGSHGTLAHELTHLKRYHASEKFALFSLFPGYVIPEPSPALSILRYNDEFEADQLYATTNVANARIMERFAKNLKPERASATHPASLVRHKAVQQILEIMVAQDRWYAGAKGYAKYGEPAFESMWDRRCEQQRIKNFTSLLGAI